MVDTMYCIFKFNKTFYKGFHNSSKIAKAGKDFATLAE